MDKLNWELLRKESLLGPKAKLFEKTLLLKLSLFKGEASLLKLSFFKRPHFCTQNLCLKSKAFSKSFALKAKPFRKASL